MELQLPTLGLILGFILFLFVSVSKLRHRDRTLNLKYPLPPGPWKLPIIGSVHHMVGGGHPHRVLCSLSKKYGDVMDLKMGEVDLVVISSPEAAMEVMGTNDLNFASRPEFAINKICNFNGAMDVALAPYGDHWRQIRKIINLELLGGRRVKSLSWLREDEVSKLVRHIFSCHQDRPRGKSDKISNLDNSFTLRAQRELQEVGVTGDSEGHKETPHAINLSEKFLALSNKIAFRAVFDKNGMHQERLSSAFIDLLRSSTMFGLVELFPSVGLLPIVTGSKAWLLRKFRRVDSILDEIILDHQKSSSSSKARKEDVENEAFLDVLLRILEQGDLEVPLNINNVKAVTTNLLTGGSDTTAGVMEWAMAELMRNPRVMEKAQAEVRSALRGKETIQQSDVDDGLTYLKMVVKETLRLHPPVPLLVPRICSETCHVSGYSVAAGRKVVINAWALGRDPEYWDEPERFEPERFINGSVDFKGSSFQFVPFGAGRRMCPGIGFGLAVVELVLAQLLFYFDWDLPGGMLPQDLDMAEVFGTIVHRKSDLILLARPHIFLSG